MFKNKHSTFLDKNWLAVPSYLSDIFDKRNGINFSLRGQNANILPAFWQGFRIHQNDYTPEKIL